MTKFTLPSEDLKYLFNACKKAVSKGDRRPIMECLHFNCKDGNLTVSAVDGYRYHSVSMPITIDEGGDFDFYIQPFTLPKMLQVVVIEILEKEVVFDFITRKFVEKKVEGENGIKVSDILPKNPPTFRIAFNPSYLIEAVQSLNGKCTNRNPVVLEFQTDDNKKPCIIRNNSNDDDFRLILPVRLK